MTTTVARVCGDVYFGAGVEVCECGCLREAGKPHAYDNGTLSAKGEALECEVLESVRKAMHGGEDR